MPVDISQGLLHDPVEGDLGSLREAPEILRDVEIHHHFGPLGETRDGLLFIVMSRYDAMGEVADFVPLGPTTPEMAAIMGALGASDAVMLDGGISAQLMLRDPARAEPLRWPGLRKVPLGLIARPRGH